MDHLDIFLNTKDSLLKDDAFDILDGESWCLDDDKFLESIRYGDKIDTMEEITESPEQIFLPEDTLSPCSASSCSTSSDQFDDVNVKVVQLVGILPHGVKAIQILQQEDMITEEIIESDHNDQTNYQELKLSEEEKRLLNKEGISLPSHYPLTKYEERELKRIRRKIRNKISAQDSRKRKKEFLDKLQSRVQEVEEEKSNLAKKCRTLEAANSKLSAQVKRLQAALSNATSKQSAQTHMPAATTLLVLILSLALVVLPTVKRDSGEVVTFEDQNSSLAGRSRTMMNLTPDPKPLLRNWKSLDPDEDEPKIKIPRFSYQHQQLDTKEKKVLSGGLKFNRPFNLMDNEVDY